MVPTCLTFQAAAAVADTREGTEQLIKEAIESHLEAMAEDNDPIPEPTSYAKEIEVVVPQKAASQAAKKAG